MNNIGQQKNSR